MKKTNSGLLDAIHDIMDIPGEGQSTPPPEAPQMQMKMKQRKENLKQHNFRMKDSEWNRLKDHFYNKGLSIASGLRMIILEYMKKEGI